MKAVFIGGCGRSGTTLLGSLMGSHSSCVTVPESQFKYRMFESPGSFQKHPGRLREYLSKDWRFRGWGLSKEALTKVDTDPVRAMTTLVRSYGRERLGKEGTFWIDHTPDNFDHALSLVRHFPDAKFIHIVRDGRAVAASVLPLPWGPNVVVDAANWWLKRVGIGLASEAHFGAEVALRVHFGDLVREPETTMLTIQRFLGLPEEPVALVGRASLELPEYTRGQHALVNEAPSTARIDAWKATLTSREVELFELQAGVMLEYLGYARASVKPIRPQSNWEAIRSRLYRTYRWMSDRGIRRRRQQVAASEVGLDDDR